jgi:hypothetical protein
MPLDCSWPNRDLDPNDNWRLATVRGNSRRLSDAIKLLRLQYALPHAGANLVMRHNRLRSWWLTVSVLTCGGQVQSVQADEVLPPRESCEMRRLASVNLKRTSTGSILVPVSINGVAALMYIEIASHLSVITQQAVDRMKLPVKAFGPGVEAFSGSQRVSDYALIHDFAVGELAFRDQGLLIDPQITKSARYDSDDVVGVLGNGLLWTMDLELDLAAGKLNFYEPGKCTHPVYWATEYVVVPLQRNPLGEIFFPMKLDGRKIEATFSTGNAVTTLSTDVTKRVYGFDKDTVGIETQKDSNGMVVASYRAMKMSTSGLSVIDERVRLVDPPHRCQLTRKGDVIGYTGCLYFYPLRLGNSILEHLHIYIDTKANRMYFTDAGNKPAH